MKVLIAGASGMLGQALVRTFQSQHEVIPVSSRTLDIGDFEAVARLVATVHPAVILNAAAYTDVDGAETEVTRAYRVNALGARNLAAAAEQVKACLVYFSTDYVFDGKTAVPYREWDSANPLSQYGWSKWAGEAFVRELCPSHLVIRTSWLFGPGGRNFVIKVVERAKSTGRLEVVNDRRGSPTFTEDLATITAQLVHTGRRGVYHVTNSSDCTWYELAREVLARTGLNAEIRAISSQELISPARRPEFSVLDNFMLKLEGFSLLPSWKEAVGRFLNS